MGQISGGSSQDKGSDRGTRQTRARVIVTLGDLALDILVQPDRAGGPRRTDSPGSVKMTGGGWAANFAVWVSRLGHNSRAIGKVGTDPAADLLVLDLLKEGVLAEAVTEAGSTATFVHMVQRHGEPVIMPDRGVAPRLKPEELQARWFSGARWLHLPGSVFFEMPIATAAGRAVRMAREAGAKVSVNLAGAAGLKRYGVGRFSVLLKTLAPDVIFSKQDEAMLFSSGALGALAEVAVLRLADGSCVISDERGSLEVPVDSLARAATVDASGVDEAFEAAWCVTHLGTGKADLACRRAMTLAARVAAQPGSRPLVSLAGVKAN
ncbi:MAG: carbohydrate kinase family protein [Chloroflexota bacterium]